MFVMKLMHFVSFARIPIAQFRATLLLVLVAIYDVADSFKLFPYSKIIVTIQNADSDFI